MKTRLTLTLALLLICTGAALAQTPDLIPPAGETVCDSETGAAFGLCNAYCEAMDCDSDAPQASETACLKVRTRYFTFTSLDVPCERPVGCPSPPPGTTCPCVDAFSNFNTVLNGTPTFCSDTGVRTSLFTDDGVVAAACTNPARGSHCLYATSNLTFIQELSITPEEASACMELIRTACDNGGPAT